MKLETLKAQIKRAIADEDYEEAARLRDLIYKIENGEIKEEELQEDEGEFKPVTRDELLEWMMENEEDVVADGPYMLTHEHWDELGFRIYSKLESVGVEIPETDEDWYDIIFEIMHSVGFTQDNAYDVVLETMAELINEFRIPKY
jgi:hypothetical protein